MHAVITSRSADVYYTKKEMRTLGHADGHTADSSHHRREYGKERQLATPSSQFGRPPAADIIDARVDVIGRMLQTYYEITSMRAVVAYQAQFHADNTRRFIRRSNTPDIIISQKLHLLNTAFIMIIYILT